MGRWSLSGTLVRAIESFTKVKRRMLVNPGPVLPLHDRAVAGRLLAERVEKACVSTRPVRVVALPRGGVPVAAPIAQALHASLTVLVVRKIGAPGQPELALAAVAEGHPPEVVFDPVVRAKVHWDPVWWQRQLRQAQAEVVRRVQVYRGGRPLEDLAGSDVVLVDDGIATGATVRAARQVLLKRHPTRVLLAVPVAPAQEWFSLRRDFDDVFCLAQPTPFGSVGAHYTHFPQITDEQVITLLEAAQGFDVPRRPTLR